MRYVIPIAGVIVGNVALVTAVRLMQDAGERRVAVGGGEAIVNPAEPAEPWLRSSTVVVWGHEHTRHRH